MFNLYFILFSWHIIYSPLSISLTHTHTFKKIIISSHIMNSLVWFSETHTDSDTFMLTHVQSHTFTQRAPSDTEISLETYSSIPVPPFLPLPSPPLLASRPLCNAARVHLSPLSSLSPTFSSFPSLPTTSRWLKLFLWFYLPSLAHRQSFPSSCLCHFYFLLNCCRFSFSIGKYLC